MSHSTCPNCGETVATAVTLGPPTACPECCARLSTGYALGAPAPGGAQALDLDIAVAAESAAPHVARGEFRSFAADLDAHVSSTAELLISELVTNAVIHGPAAASTVALHCSIVGATLQVEIADAGTGFAPQARAEDPAVTSGWGLHMVECLADAWGVDEGRPTRVWFELAL
jgi:anti-sigma regulatory factor (Ser/Thr protein kinase)